MDSEERRRFDLIKQKARRDGKDIITALNEAGALLTSKRERRGRADLLAHVADELENASIGRLIRESGGSTSSALDAQRAMVEFLRGMARRYLQ